MFLPARSSESQLVSRLVSEQSPVISGDGGGDISGEVMLVNHRHLLFTEVIIKYYVLYSKIIYA